MALITIDNLHKRYGSTHALRGVDTEIEERQWVNIMGPSGSGKSTLLNIVSGLESPSEGSVHIDGVDLASLTDDALALFRREHTGFVFQQAHLIPYLDAVGNVMLAQHFHSMVDEEEARNALARVGLEERLKHLPSQMSGGEQQRVCIARALINSPEVLLADEPTGNLDRENTTIILDLLSELHRERHFTVIMVTHDPYVTRWSQRLLTMVDGRLDRDELTPESESQT